MKVWGVTSIELQEIVNVVSKRDYKNNLTFNRWPWGSSERAHSFTLKVKNSKGLGHRHGLKFLGYGKGYTLGRRLVSACWHAHRDVMLELFKQFPDARLKSGYHVNADYNGKEDFLYKYEETGYSNIGGSMFPFFIQDACECNPPTLDEIIGLK